MKKIEFYFNNQPDALGPVDGWGIKPGLLLPDAEYYGAIKYEDNSYIVAKVTKDEYGRFPHLMGKFIVRPAIADLYVDGSGNLFLDQEESLTTQQLEARLNEPQISERVFDINGVLNNCNGVHMADMAFKFLTLGDTFIATSITHEAFERKNSALKSCRGSFSQIQEQLLSVNNNYSR